MYVVTVKHIAKLLLAVAIIVGDVTVALATDRMTDLERRAERASLEAGAALEFATRFRQMAEQAMDEIYFLPIEQRDEGLAHAARLRDAAARAQATWHRLNEFSSEIQNELHQAVAARTDTDTREGYDYRIVDAITSDIVDAAIIVEVPSPQLSPEVVISEEPDDQSTDENYPASFESAPVPEAFPSDDSTVTTTGSIGSAPVQGEPLIEEQVAHARELASRALNFAVEIQVEAEQAAANFQRFKDFRGKVDPEQFAEIRKKAELLTEEARLAELEYQLLDSRAADLEAELAASRP